MSFALGAYDRHRTLVIDPTFDFVFIEVNYANFSTGVSMDSSGNTYVCGNQFTFDKVPYGHSVAYITKLSPTYATDYITYFGGDAGDSYGYGIATDVDGNAYSVGETSSSDFPTTKGCYQRTFSNGGSDGFLVKLDPTGAHFVYSTYLGGSGKDSAVSLALDQSDDAYVAGYTNSLDFPTTPGVCQPSIGANGASNAFICEINPGGTAAIYSTYLGGSGRDYGAAIQIDATGAAYVTGSTSSVDFPMQGPAQGSLAGIVDAFLTKVSPGATKLDYSTYLGGEGYTWGRNIAVTAAGVPYVVGFTTAPNFPTSTTAFQRNYSGYEDGFISQFNSNGSELTASTLLGINSYTRMCAITLDQSGNVYVAGQSQSTQYPITAQAIQKINRGSWDVVYSIFNSSLSNIAYSTYMGGGKVDAPTAIVLDTSGNMHFSGVTMSADFLNSSHSKAYKKGTDGFELVLKSGG